MVPSPVAAPLSAGFVVTQPEAASDRAAAIRKASHRMDTSPDDKSIGGKF